MNETIARLAAAMNRHDAEGMAARMATRPCSNCRERGADPDRADFQGPTVAGVVVVTDCLG